MIKWPVCYGYRTSDPGIDIALKAIKPALDVRVTYGPSARVPVLVALPIRVLNCTYPRPDCSAYNQAVSVLKRVGRLPNPRSAAYQRRFYYFVRKFLQKFVAPVEWTDEVDFEEYLAGTSYSQTRKQHLREIRAEFDAGHFERPGTEYSEVAVFGKDESYPEFKALRMIMPRSDEFKVTFGPYVHCAEKEIYKLRFFCKGKTEHEKIAIILDMDKIGSNKYGTDHSSFEAAINLETRRACELQLLTHMFKKHPNFKTLKNVLSNVLGRRNLLRSRKVRVKGLDARMSGDNHTSLGNGFTNIMAILFAVYTLYGEKGIDEVSVVVEGDDALVDDGMFDRHAPRRIAQEMVRNGFEIKMEIGPATSEVGFCQLLVDVDSRVAIGDPSKILVNFGWTRRQYAFSSGATLRALMRAKALSYLSLYPACPIVAPFMWRVVELTNDVSFYKMVHVLEKMKVSEYERERLKRSLVKTPREKVPFSARMFVFHRFGIDPGEQEDLERFFSQVDAPFDLPACLEHLIHPDCFEFMRSYSVDYAHYLGTDPVLDIYRPDWDKLKKLCVQSGARFSMRETVTTAYRNSA